jgi:malonyl-CoA O-methyltransferase
VNQRLNPTSTTREAYERWAPVYPPVAHNPLMRIEQQVMLEQWPDVAGCLALDLGCGTGRYTKLLAQARAQHVVALDFCPPMLSQVADASRVQANMMELPFCDAVFDVVVSGLALGHATDVRKWMTEVSRVLRPGGVLLYSDFHPEAARAGLTRSFKDRNQQTCTVPHYRYDVAVQMEAVGAAGLNMDVMREVRVGVELREPFPRSDEFYRQWHGLPIALVVRARK